MSYPKQMFRAGGPYGPRPGYGVCNCVDADHEESLKEKGWTDDRDAALGLKAEPEQEAFTREELEGKAKELGVSFNARTKDETLVNRIAEALG